MFPRAPPAPAYAPYLSHSPYYSPVRIGAEAEKKEEVERSLAWSAFKAITPTLFLAGVVTGAAFALGSGLVARYIFGSR